MSSTLDLHLMLLLSLCHGIVNANMSILSRDDIKILGKFAILSSFKIGGRGSKQMDRLR